MKQIQMKRVLLWYPDPRKAPGVCTMMALPSKRNTIFKQLRPNDYVDLTREEATIAGGDCYFAGRYELKLMVEKEKK